MTNYNLEEFKVWLEENPNQKARFYNWDAVFNHLANGESNEGFGWKWTELANRDHPSNQNRNGEILSVIWNYMEEANVRERERERSGRWP